jgi:hypothetical protein
MRSPGRSGRRCGPTASARCWSFERLEPDARIALALEPRAWDYRVLCPVLPGEVALFGDVSKFVTVGDEESAGEAAANGTATGGHEGPRPLARARRLPWFELMRRTFAVDVLECRRCHGRMRIVAVIDQPEVIATILTHLSLPARAPPPRPARTDPLGTLHGEAPDSPDSF